MDKIFYKYIIKMVLTYKQKFNRKYGFKRDESHSLNEISKLNLEESNSCLTPILALK